MSAQEACACPHCGKPVAIVGADTPKALTVAVAKIAGIGLARTRHDPAVEIIRRTAALLGTTPTALLGTDRHRSIAFARHLAMYVIRRDLDRSYPEIGTIFGHRDHTSAMHGVRRILDMLSHIDTGDDVAKLVEVISTGQGIDDVTLAVEDEHAQAVNA